VAQEANLSFKNRFPYNSVIDEASDFKFGTQLKFAKAHHKMTPKEKIEVGLGLKELSNILRFPYNISAKVGASDFKFGMRLGFAKSYHKITRRRKGGHGLRELPKIWGSPSVFIQWLKLATSNLVHSLDLVRTIII